MKQRTKLISLILGVIIVSSLALLFKSQSKEIQITSSSRQIIGSDSAIDVVFQNRKDITIDEIDAFSITSDGLEPIEKNYAQGYGSKVDVDRLTLLYNHFSVGDFEEMQSELGQFSFHRRFDEIDYYIFDDWYEQPWEIHLVTLIEDKVHMKSETFSSEITAYSFNCTEHGGVVLLGDVNQVYLRIFSPDFELYEKVSLPMKIYSYQVTSFFVLGDILYLGVKNFADDNTNSTIFEYNLTNGSLNEITLENYSLDFLFGYGYELCYGTLLDEETISLVRQDLVSGNTQQSELKTPEKVREIVSSDSYYDGERLYLTFFGEFTDDFSDSQVFCCYLVESNTLLSYLEYAFVGAMSKRFYEKDGLFLNDVKNAAGN